MGASFLSSTRRVAGDVWLVTYLLYCLVQANLAGKSLVVVSRYSRRAVERVDASARPGRENRRRSAQHS
ncbi:unnamed protein product [Lampetra planeri]